MKRLYEKKVDAAFRDLREHGFRIARDLLGQPTNLPHVHIGRGGEILYGTRENHRLAMAKLWSLRVIPCNVRARHADWQKVREAVQEGVDAGNEKLARVEQVKKFVIVPGDWLPGGDELTPTMKLKRKPIAEKYAEEIESLYAG